MSTRREQGKLLVPQGRLRLKCDGTRAETRFRLSAETDESAEASFQSTAGIRGVRISCNNAGYTMFRGSVKNTGYPLHSPVSPSFPLPWVTVCHHIPNAVYLLTIEPELPHIIVCGTQGRRGIASQWYNMTDRQPFTSSRWIQRNFCRGGSGSRKFNSKITQTVMGH